MNRSALLLSMVVGCMGPSEREPRPEYGPELTDTVPQFRGSVPRNLVMISIDTLRRDVVDRYASPEWRAEHGPIMPYLSGLLEEGLALDDFVQCSNWTFPSTSCTLAGRYGTEAGMIPRIRDDERQPWPEGTPFLASHLRDIGFYSVLSTTNGFLSDRVGNEQGYQRWFYPFDGRALGAFREGMTALQEVQEGGLADRWFLHIHVVEPHAVYQPPGRYLEEVEELPPSLWNLSSRDTHYEARDLYPAMTTVDRELLKSHLEARYRAEARWLDDQLFQIHQELTTAGMLDDALLVLWSDHGEAFWEHGYQTHAYTLHAEETDAIAVMWARNIVPQAWTGPTHAIDLAPTLLNLWTGSVPEPMTGLPVGQAPADRPRFATAVARLGTMQSVQKDGWKLIFPWPGGIRLYDRNKDPAERNNLYDAADLHPKAIELWQDLRPFVERTDVVMPDRQVRWPEALESAK